VLLTRIQEAAASQHPIPNWARSVNTGLNNMSTGSSTDAATMSASGRRKLAIKKAQEVWKRGFKRFRGKFPSFKPVSFTTAVQACQFHLDRESILGKRRGHSNHDVTNI